MSPLDQASPEQLRQQETLLSEQFQQLQQQHLDLDLTRGKPSSAQLDLSKDMDGILHGDYRDSSGVDLRNYGGLDGIAEAKRIVRNHRLWEAYLISFADIAPGKVDRDADQIEHVLGQAMVDQLEELLVFEKKPYYVPPSPHPLEG